MTLTKNTVIATKLFAMKMDVKDLKAQQSRHDRIFNKKMNE